MKEKADMPFAAGGRGMASDRALSASARSVFSRACVPAVRLPAVALFAFLPAAAAFADGPGFRFAPPLAGRASLVEDGFVLRRKLGVVAIAPELRIPIGLVYEEA